MATGQDPRRAIGHLERLIVDPRITVYHRAQHCEEDVKEITLQHLYLIVQAILVDRRSPC